MVELGELSQGGAMPVMDWRGSHVWVRKGVSCTGESKQGSRGEVRYVAVNRGMAGHVKAVTARNTNYLERRHNAIIYKQVFIS